MNFSSGFSITNAMAAGSTTIEQPLALVKSLDSFYTVFNTPATPLGRKADAQLGRVSFCLPEHFPAWQAAS